MENSWWHTPFDPSTQEAEAGRSLKVYGQAGLYRETLSPNPKTNKQTNKQQKRKMGMRRKGNEWKKEVKVILSFLVKIK